VKIADGSVVVVPTTEISGAMAVSAFAVPDGK